jgi:hypothetical protein
MSDSVIVYRSRPYLSSRSTTAYIDAAAPLITPTTWNSADANGQMAGGLSGGNLTATNGGSNKGWVRTVTGRNSGKYYWEITIVDVGSYIGIADITFDTTGTGGGYPGNTTGGSPDTAGIYAGTPSNVYFNSTIAFAAPSALAVGQVLGFAFDITNLRLYIHQNGTYLNSGNPSAGTGYADVSVLGAATYYPFFFADQVADAVTANFGGTAFTYSVPTGFSSGFGANA